MTMARLTVLLAILLAIPSVARAQLGWLPPQKGLPLETTQPTHAEGRITVTTDVGQQFLLREIDYMVAPWPQSRYTARYRTVNAVRWEGGFSTRQAAGIELLEGAAYFHIEPPVMPLGPGDVVQIVNLQPISTPPCCSARSSITTSSPATLWDGSIRS